MEEYGNEATTILTDIVKLRKPQSHDYSFLYVQRSFVACVDRLAKEARVKNDNYVTSWRNAL